MVREDIWGSISHVSMLGHQKIIPVEDAAKIINALGELYDDFEAGKWGLRVEREDVHMKCVSRLLIVVYISIFRF